MGFNPGCNTNLLILGLPCHQATKGLAPRQGQPSADFSIPKNDANL